MRTFYTTIVFGLTTSALAAPRPQVLNYALVNGAGPAPNVTVPIGAYSTFMTYDATAVASDTAARVTAELLPQQKRSLDFWHTLPSRAISSGKERPKRSDGACNPLPSGHGPVPSPDTPSAFLSYAAFASAATQAPTPSGYVKSFTNLQASNVALGFMGSVSQSTYDPSACAKLCDSHNGCIGFNIFFERDPTKDPGAACSNPPSTTVIRCVFWGGPVTTDNAKSIGERISAFQVVIAGSNGYYKSNTAAIAGYNGLTALGNAAIHTPDDQTYMGYYVFDDGRPFDSQRCAAACTAQSAYNIAHSTRDESSPKLCRFFNTYILNLNGIPQSQMCVLYTQSWTSSYATNSGQTEGSNVYTQVHDSGLLNVDVKE
ncbi:hypothetical protein LTR50_005510 [Elasticomyces elasticus]|nr:hypothetical protein LTR50_005510 [Elasticomyces elasticus]